MDTQRVSHYFSDEHVGMMDQETEQMASKGRRNCFKKNMQTFDIGSELQSKTRSF